MMASSDGKDTAVEHYVTLANDDSAGSSSPTHSAPEVVHAKAEDDGHGEPVIGGMYSS